MLQESDNVIFGEQCLDLAARLREVVAARRFSPKELLAGGSPGRPIPVYLVCHSRAARLLGVETEKFFTDFKLHLEGQLKAALTFGGDFVYHAADAFDFEAEALGMNLVFADDKSMPDLSKPPLAEDRNYERLRPKDLLNQGRLSAFRLMKSFLIKELGDIFLFEATGCAPFSLAVHLRGYESLLMDAVVDPDYVHGLMDFCVDIVAQNLSAQLDLGLDAVRVADAWAAFPMVNPAIHKEIIFPHMTDLFGRLNCSRKAWSGVYGLAKHPNWPEQLAGMFDCGLTEATVYQDDLEAIDLGRLADLIVSRSAGLNLGLYGFSLVKMPFGDIKELIDRWLAGLSKAPRVGVHVSNLPYDVDTQAVIDFVDWAHQTA